MRRSIVTSLPGVDPTPLVRKAAWIGTFQNMRLNPGRLFVLILIAQTGCVAVGLVLCHILILG
jgi:hypothetical protein